MGDRMTVDEMRKTYDGEWVLVVDCEDDESGRLARGRVVVHSANRDDIYREMANHPEGCAVRWFGEVPADQIVILILS